MKRLIDSIGLTLVGAFVGVVLIIVVAPFLYSLVMSFDPRLYLGTFPPPGISGQWYAKFFSDERYVRALWTSLFIALTSSVAACILGTLAALGLLRIHREAPRAALDGMFASPKFVPNVVIGFALLMAFSIVGIGAGFTAITCAHLLIVLPLVVRSVSAALDGIKPSLIDAAMSLGATRAQAIFDVVIPLARTGIAVGFVFAMAVSLDEVAASAFLTTPSVVTLPVVLISDMKANFDLTIAAAAVMMMVLVLVVVAVLDITVGIERLLGRGSYGDSSNR